MAEPIPAGSDVSPDTYPATGCGYELEVGSTHHAASATQIPALAALHTTSKRPTPSKRKSARTSSTPPVCRNLSSLIRRSQTSASTKLGLSRGMRPVRSEASGSVPGTAEAGLESSPLRRRQSRRAAQTADSGNQSGSNAIDLRLGIPA
jgi:hypothetical protein